METRPLGRTGISVSAIGFGCGSTGGLFVRGSFEDQRQAVEAALEGGINYFDTAAQYGDGKSEQNLGRVLRHFGRAVHVGTKLRVTREDLGDIRSVVRSRLEAGLRRLGRERVDVCTLHTRLGVANGALTSAEVIGPVADALAYLKRVGLTDAIGFTGLGDTDEILSVAQSNRFDSVQCYYNLLNQSAARPGSPDGTAQDFGGLLNVVAETGIGALCIRVLAGGALSSEPDRHPLAGATGAPMAEGQEFAGDYRRAQELALRLGEYGANTLPELAIRFALHERRLSSVLVGFSDHSHVSEALASEAKGPLSAESIRALHDPYLASS